MNHAVDSSKLYGASEAGLIAGIVNDDVEWVFGEPWLEVRDDGVFLSAAYVEKMSCLSGFKGFDEDFFWNPAWELEDGPSPLTAPLLPIPFTAQDLSALLVGTISCFIRDQFGEIGHLNESKLESCLGKKGREAKKALREAYALAADAMAVVGTPETLDASTDEGRRKWREAMVRALLERAEDAESQAAPAVERQGEARTPAELAPESKATPKHTKHDDIQIEIDDVKAWLEKQETRATPNTVMAELKKRAGQKGSCITEAFENGVLWVRGNNGGNERLTYPLLKSRLQRRRVR